MIVLVAMLSAMLMGIPAILLHECGHLAVALLCGVKVKRVGISWTGFYTVREPGPKWANLCISFAGPVMNLLLAAALLNTLPAFAKVNLIACIFNLFPIPHSDGTRIVALLRQPGGGLTLERREERPPSDLAPTSM